MTKNEMEREYECDDNEVEARRHTKTTTPSVKFVVGMLTVVRLFQLCNLPHSQSRVSRHLPVLLVPTPPPTSIASASWFYESGRCRVS